MRYIVLFVALLALQSTAAIAKDRIKIQIYVTSEVEACGPQGYLPRPHRCTRLLADKLEQEDETFRLLKPAYVVPPPDAVRLKSGSVAEIREYQSLGKLPLPQRKSAVIVFTWLDRVPTTINLKRTLSTRDEAYQVEVSPKSKRTIYHLPLQYLNPALHDQWTLSTDYGRYVVRFRQGGVDE